MRCSVAMSPRFFKLKMLRESGPYALLLRQLLIARVTWSLVNDSASSRGLLNGWLEREEMSLVCDV